MARTAPIDCVTVRRSLLKLGDTPFAARHVDIELDSGLMLPVSALNALRRSAIERLTALDTPARTAELSDAVKAKPTKKRVKTRTAMFYDVDAIPEIAYEYFDIVYTPLERYTGSTNGVALPPVIFDSERERVCAMLDRAKNLGAEHVLVGNLGHMELAQNSGMTVHGDFRLNVCNNGSAAYIESLGFEDVILSPELTLAQMRDVGGRTAVCVYGRAPLMITEKCVGKEVSDCAACTSGKSTLTDRRGVTFPVLRAFEHRSMIVNSVPFYMADRAAELDKNGITMRHFIFTVESKSEADKVIAAYKNGLSPKDTAKVKRIK